jgi:hypothetical protein
MHNHTDSHRAGDVTLTFDEGRTKCLVISRTFTSITLASMDAQQTEELLEFLLKHRTQLKRAQEVADGQSRRQ